ncbi:MAG: hypothetical protein ACFCUU_08845 [Cyclobacteriaceae bacterium]
MNRLIFIGLLASLISACNPSTQNHEKMNEPNYSTKVVEITNFSLHHGVSIEDFKNLATQMQAAFLSKQHGFVKRTLTISADSIWTDIVYWQDQQSFENAMKLAETSEEVLPFMEKIDFNSVKMNLTTPIILEE